MCIYVRELTAEEGMRLKRYLRKGKDPVTINRAHVILASAQGMRVPEIAQRYHYSRKWVRRIIHRFNEEGLEAIFPRYAGGRPPTFTGEQKARIVETALSRPTDLGLPFTQWSLSKLQEYLVKEGVVESISQEWIRRILLGAGVTYQRTKTWLQSRDPEYEFKKTGS
jgi:transposase